MGAPQAAAALQQAQSRQSPHQAANLNQSAQGSQQQYYNPQQGPYYQGQQQAPVMHLGPQSQPASNVGKLGAIPSQTYVVPSSQQYGYQTGLGYYDSNSSPAPSFNTNMQQQEQKALQQVVIVSPSHGTPAYQIASLIWNIQTICRIPLIVLNILSIFLLLLFG